jgi:hypothetical protein
MELNSEILNPKLYEKMAKEYQKNLNKNTLNFENNKTEICKNLDTLNSCFVKLKSFNFLSQTNKNYLNLIAKKFETIEDFCLKFFDYNLQKNTSNSDYCQCLTNGISSMVNTLKYFCFDISIFTQEIYLCLIELIEIFSKMYGVCKYRK